MSNQLTVAQANNFKTLAVSVTLCSNAGTPTTPGTEISGITRATPTWGTPTTASPSVLTGTANFASVPAGSSVAGWNAYDGSGNFLTGGSATTASSGAAFPYNLTMTINSTVA